MTNIGQINREIIKPFYKIEVKVKTHYKTFWAQSFDVTVSNVHFIGVEVPTDFTTDNLEDAAKTLKDGDQSERFYPWSSVVEIEIKRFTKNG